MSNPSAASKSQPKLIESLLEAAKKAFDPTLDTSTRQAGLAEYNEVIDGTETWVLLPTLNTLIKPDVLPPWLREPIMQTLTRLPLRSDGVRGTMEFIFSVHPSNNENGTDASAPQKQGVSITHEAVAVVTKLLSSVPSAMTPQQWFNGISSQLFQLMDGQGGSDLARTAAQIVGFGILGKRQYGAPGSPGWNVFVQPLLEDVNPSLVSKNTGFAMSKDDQPEVIDLSQDRILVRAGSLAQSLQRLSVLILSNPSPGLCKRVLKPVFLQTWALASWSNPLPLTEQEVCKPARDLFRTYLRLFGSADTISPIIRDLLCKGSPDKSDKAWKYKVSGKGGVEVVEPRSFDSISELELNWNEIENKSAMLVEHLSSSCPMEEVSSIFLGLLRQWIKTAGKQNEMGIDIKVQDSEPDSESSVQELIEVTILQKLMDKAPEKLVSHFDQLLDLVCQVLKADAQSNLGDDIIAVVLSLLNLVVTAPTFKKSHINPDELKAVEASLERVSKEDRAQVSPTARNLSLLLRYRDDVEQSDEPATAPSNRQVEDRRTYNLAMNYITGGSDNPPPVVSEGLNMLSGLIVAGSPILDIPAITVLMSSLLSENEDYINLRVIKVFTQIANKHPKSVVHEILDHYLDAQERLSTDVRLRFGEALLQVTERLGETFTGDIARQVGETLLSIAGRRGYRPKTMKKQAREERLHKMKSKTAEEAGTSDLLDEEEETTEEEKANNDILAQIIRGWESKRGSEDIRMRASALSIFGTALETNIGGLGPTLASGSVDLCINVLTMERELETAILRRAAILNVLSFARALDRAKETGVSLGFGLTNESRENMVMTLKYVAATDEDGLVKQHAEDVVESLESWHMASLLPGQDRSAGPELGTLAGLHVNPAGTLVDASGQVRPRIEEVE